MWVRKMGIPLPTSSQSLAMVSPWEGQTAIVFLSLLSSIPGRHSQEDLVSFPPASSHSLVAALLQVQESENMVP